MDLSYSEEYETFRAELREFLAGWPLTGAEAELPAEEQEQRFRQRGIEKGYVYRNIPRQYGGSGQEYDAFKEAILREEYSKAGAPGDSFYQGPALLAPTLVEFGTEAQKARFVPKTLSGEYTWCQGYSEPGSGSDLASLQSTARLEGDEWVINGQKIWTSNAHEADYMFGLFRTEPDAPKHGGISYLLIDMKSPGIEVRPLKQLDGCMEFNEVFFDDARTPADWILGERGQGWAISRATLKHERNLIGDPNSLRRDFEALVRLARRTERNGRPAIEDSAVRQRLMEIKGYLRAGETSNLRTLSALAHGRELEIMLPMMMAKLFGTDTDQRIAKALYDLLDSDGMLAPAEADIAGMGYSDTPRGYVDNYLFSLGPAIAGGASNIQLNIIGERGYGLPRDLRPPKE